MIDGKIQKDVITRLKKVEGQVKGIMKMVEEKRYCIEVLMQILAAESALHKTSEIVLRNHIETCVYDAFRSSDEMERKRKIDELMKIYSKVRMK